MANQVYKAVFIDRNQRIVLWYESKDEAIEDLMKRFARQAVDSIPRNGGDNRIKAFQEACSKYQSQLDDIDGMITLFDESKKK